MKKNIYQLFSLLVISSFSFASTYLETNVIKYKENNVDVVWLKDSKLPTFTFSIYFQDGALKDPPKLNGTTKLVFDLLTSGTASQTQNEILEFFDFYGAGLSHQVTHEYSIFQISGLIKDSETILEKVCHLFKDANYPELPLKSLQERMISSLKNLPTNHAALAERAFRYFLFNGTPFVSFVDGTIVSIPMINSSHLKDRLNEVKRSYKSFYVSGPDKVKSLVKKLNSCGFEQGNKLAQNVNWKKNMPEIFFIPVEDANQAQIRMGQLFHPNEIKDQVKDSLAADFLGGGFTSKLVQELRVKRGLTYGAGAHFSAQRDYVRVGVATFTKNETLDETISVIENILKTQSETKVLKDEDVAHIKKYSIGAHPFTFENQLAFISQLILLDHRSLSYDLLDQYVSKIDSVNKDNLANNIAYYFNPDQFIKVIVGNPSLVKSLEKKYKVNVVPWSKLL